MIAALFEKIRELLSRNDSKDIAPPDAKIPTGLTRELRDAMQRKPEDNLPRAGARLRGRIESPNGHENVLIIDNEHTEELLALTEDAVEKMQEEGFDPYNTDTFTTTGAWENTKRR
ncbi:MAG: hypothetical protein AAF270_00705 [Pseudomonadota bacterium]